MRQKQPQYESSQSVNKADRVCVLVSGGLDSCVLLGMMAREFKQVFPVYIQCGLRWERAEIVWLKKYLNELKRQKRGGHIHSLDLLQLPVQDLYASHWSLPDPKGFEARGQKSARVIPGRKSADERVYLPGRNLLLLAKAGVYCSRNRIHSIAMGQLKGNPFPDATPAFLRSVERAISLALNWPLHIRTPFLKHSKSEVIRMGKTLKLPLQLSFSCLSPDSSHRRCGQCNKCAEWDRVMQLF